ncbi:hypothetical protein HanXRQr2_Chr17g0804521 [Helianthus annuus]|uniref:Uncharacterized protein n=1 Tax=Helianthus annuus TaxID=4232 RepID=A0A9K3GVC2_HELAN|nr:hypothetical protein HanXRQr2_Chr17g0804521 [Helianthus annuus]
MIHVIKRDALPCVLSLLTYYHKRRIKRKPAGQIQASLLEIENTYR